MSSTAPPRRNWLSPWRTNDLVGLVVLFGACGAILFAASLGAGGTIRTSQQTAWLGVGLAGTVLFSAGVAVWILVGRRRIRRRRVILLPNLVDSVSTVEADVAKFAGQDGDQRLVAVEHGTLFHRVTCPAVAGKPLQAVAVAGCRTSCAICRPAALPEGRP
jgi:hypothetical protein